MRRPGRIGRIERPARVLESGVAEARVACRNGSGSAGRIVLAITLTVLKKQLKLELLATVRMAEFDSPDAARERYLSNPAARRKDFLKAVQAGALVDAQALATAHPSVLSARSTSKGYGAMHYAAMAGALPLLDWLAEQGLDVVDVLRLGVAHGLDEGRRLAVLGDALARQRAQGVARPGLQHRGGLQLRQQLLRVLAPVDLG